MTRPGPDGPAPLVALQPASAADRPAAAVLLERLGADRARLVAPAPIDPIGRGDARGHRWTLRVDGAARVLTRSDGARLAIDFTAGRSASRVRENGLARQPLARAVGVTRLRRRLGRAPRVIDATAGLGGDAWIIASLGCPVTLIERSPLVHALLEAALAHAAATPATADVAARVRLLEGEATTRLGALGRETPDVVYLDPMYPPVRRRAAVTKGMQFLHELLGPDTNDAGLLGAALDAAGHRVTVKRPRGAAPLAGDAVSAAQRSTIESTTTRYDVYHLVADGA